jgi:hypothetical protein
VSSVNGETPDTNGNVSLNAEDIPAEGVGSKDVSGNPIIITDGVAENAQNLSVDLEPIQDLHGYDKPWAGGAGKNLFNPSSVSIGYYVRDDDGTLRQDSNNVASDYIEVAGGQTYRISPVLSSGNWGAWYNENKEFISGITNYSGGKTAPSNAKYMRFTVSRNGNNPDYATTTQVEKGSTATAYEPYSNICPISGRTQVEISNKDSEDAEQASVTVDLGQTVYGGTLNVTTGEMVVDKAMVDLGTLTWNRTASYTAPVFYTNVAGKLKSDMSMLCSVYKFIGNFGSASGFAMDSENASIGNCYANEQIFVRDDSYTDAASFKSAMSGVQLVYQLATPQTIQLTPAQIQLLEGYNILTTDGDTLNLRYTGTVASNVQSEIDEFEESTRKLAGSLAMIETSPATANHAVGDYISFNTQFCKVTQAISVGEIVQIGRNVQVTTVAAELMAILAQLQA